MKGVRAGGRGYDARTKKDKGGGSGSGSGGSGGGGGEGTMQRQQRSIQLRVRKQVVWCGAKQAFQKSKGLKIIAEGQGGHELVKFEKERWMTEISDWLLICPTPTPSFFGFADFWPLASKKILPIPKKKFCCAPIASFFDL